MPPLALACRLAARLVQPKARVRAPLAPEFRQFVKEAGVAAAYLEANPDFVAEGFEPLTRWLKHGLEEGRVFPGIEIRHGSMVASYTQADWRRFT